MRRILRLLPTVLLCAFMQACTGIGYYAQSVGGHLDVLARREKVQDIIDDPKRPEPLRARMALAADIRAFASAELGLPDNDSYRAYVDLERDYVTWAVFVTPEFSLQAMTWCFPVYGCVPYRGYFSRDEAVKFAEQQRKNGLDVHGGGITAYSTLGWTSDPLLNTMFRQDEAYLAGLVFHELAHQRVYVANDTAFNESFAVAVEVTGVRRWFARTGDRQALARFEADQKRQIVFRDLVTNARAELEALYATGLDAGEKRKRKAAIIDTMRQRYRAIRDGRWGGYDGYDGWFETPINNAKFAATAFYSDMVPSFLALFEQCGEDYPRFYAAVEKLTKLPPEERTKHLLSKPACS